MLPTQGQPVVARTTTDGRGCGDDAQAGGTDCRVFRNAVEANDEVARARKNFAEAASSTQQQVLAVADPGGTYDALKTLAIEDGTGHNDLTGRTPGTRAVPPDMFLQSVRERLAALARAERQILHLVRFPGGPGPTGPDSLPRSMGLGTTTIAPAPTTPR